MPLFSEHISNMYYSGSPSYSSPYSSYTSSYSPLGTSYSASYLNPGGSYSNHSSIGSYSRTPLPSRWISGLNRGYSPMLTPISERGTSSPVRINSPRRIPISKRSYGTSGYTQRPININTENIDVSKHKYRRKSIETPVTASKPPLQKEPYNDDNEKSPFMPRVDGKPETGIDSSPGVQRSTIKRGRTVVRLHTVKRRERDSPRKPVETPGPPDVIQNASVEHSVVVPDNDVETKTNESKNWREKLSEDLTYPEKREKKSLGTKFVETHLVKNRNDEVETKTANNISRTEIISESLPVTLQPNSEMPIPSKSPDRRCSMELLAEQASVLDALIKKENLSTALLDISKVGVTEEDSKTLTESTKKKKSGNKENPLKTTKSDQSLHENLNLLRHNKDSKSFSKRRSLKKSFSGGSISRLDSITEFPKDPVQTELPAIEEIRTSIKIEKASEKPKPKLKTKITASVEISPPPASPLKFRIENVTVEEKVHLPKKEITFSSNVEDSTVQAVTLQAPLKRTKERHSIKRKTKNVSDPISPEPEDGNFWDKIGKRETVYLKKRKENLDEVKEKHRRALFWYPEDENAEIPDSKEGNDVVNIDNCTDINISSDLNVTQVTKSDKKETPPPLQNKSEIKNSGTADIKINSKQEQILDISSKQEDQSVFNNNDCINDVKQNSQNIASVNDNLIKLNKSESKPDLKLYSQNTPPTVIDESEINTSDKIKDTNKESSESLKNVNDTVCLENSLSKTENIEAKFDETDSLQLKSIDLALNNTTEFSESKEKCDTTILSSKDLLNKNEISSLTHTENLTDQKINKLQEESKCQFEKNANDKIHGTPLEVIKDTTDQKKPGVLINTKKESNVTSTKSVVESKLLKENEKVHSEINDTTKKETIENTANREDEVKIPTGKLSSSRDIEMKTKITSDKSQEAKLDFREGTKLELVTKPLKKPVSLRDKNLDSNVSAPQTKPIIAKDKNNVPKKLKSAKKSDSNSLNKNQVASTSPKSKVNETVQICPIHGVVNKTDSAKVSTKIDSQSPSTSNLPAEVNLITSVDLLKKTERESTLPTSTIDNTLSPCDTPSTAVPQIPIAIESENIPKNSPQSDSEKVQNELKTEVMTVEPKDNTKTEQVKQLSIKTNNSELTPSPKKPVKEEKALKPLIATPRPLQKRVPQIIHSSDSSDSSSEEESSEEEEESDTSEGSTEFFECENNADGRTSTGSNDSGFDSSAPTSPASFMQIKKGADSPGPSSSNATSQLPATDILEQELEQSTAYGIFRKTGRFTPPARSIPRFRKYMIDDFQFIKVLGKGSFGKVLLAELRDTEYYYAVKCLKKDVVLEDDDVECTLIERKVLALGTNHPYLCHLFATFQTDSHLFFVMEYLNGGDLMFHIQQSGRFPEARARFYAAEIVSGLKFLHKRGIVYRDLKLDNILLDFDGHVRIADFGMCKLQIYLEKTADTFCGTPDYMAPEIIKGLKYNQTVDWWSFGVLLYEMLIGQSPFSGCDEDELFWSICNEMPSYPRFLSQEALTILTRLLDKDARTRLGGVECMHGDIREQDFFHQIHWERLERRDLEAPFRPRVRHPLDTQYFDRAFTGERPRLTAVEPQVLRSMDQEPFRGFSYTNPNATDR